MGAVTGLQGAAQTVAAPFLGAAGVGGGGSAAGIGGVFGQLGGAASNAVKNGIPIDLGGTPLGTLSGSAGGAGGTGFAPPSMTPLTAPVTGAQVNAANAGVGTALGGQQGLLNALQGQGAVGAQSNVLGQVQGLNQNLGGMGGVGAMSSAMGSQGNLNNQLGGVGGTQAMGAALAGQGSLANQLGGAGGIGAQTGAIQGLQGVAGQQQGLANQLQNVASGQGPNPAQAMLNQATGQNVANQAALMAGQRGAGANVGLMARQAGQQGAAAQQQAVGQGATMQAQQALGAMGQLQGQQQAMGATQGQIGALGQGLTAEQQTALTQQATQGQTAAGMQQQGIAQQFGQGATGVGLQQAGQGLAAGITQNQVGNLAGVTGQSVQGNLANAGQQMGALGQFNATQAGQQASVNAANAGLATTGMQGQQGMVGGLMNAAGGAMSSMLGARGGVVQHYQQGGDVESPYAAPTGQGPLMQPADLNLSPGPVTQPPTGPQSSLGQYLSGQMSSGSFLGSPSIQATPQMAQAQDTTKQEIQAPAEMGYGSKALYKGASSLGSSAIKALAASRGGLASHGGHVDAHSPAEKATKPGNNYANDKVHAMLSEGEVVLPRSVMQSRDPARSAADFVAKVLAKRRAS